MQQYKFSMSWYCSSWMVRSMLTVPWITNPPDNHPYMPGVPAWWSEFIIIPSFLFSSLKLSVVLCCCFLWCSVVIDIWYVSSNIMACQTVRLSCRFHINIRLTMLADLCRSAGFRLQKKTIRKVSVSSDSVDPSIFFFLDSLCRSL